MLAIQFMEIVWLPKKMCHLMPRDEAEGRSVSLAKGHHNSWNCQPSSSNDANSALRAGKSALVEPSRNDPCVLFHTCKFEKGDPKESIHQHSCSFQVADGAFDDERVCWRYIPGSLSDHKIQYGSKTGTTYSAANESKWTPLERPRPKGAKKSRSSMAAKHLVVRL